MSGVIPLQSLTSAPNDRQGQRKSVPRHNDNRNSISFTPIKELLEARIQLDI